MIWFWIPKIIQLPSTNRSIILDSTYSQRTLCYRLWARNENEIRTSRTIAVQLTCSSVLKYHHEPIRVSLCCLVCLFHSARDSVTSSYNSTEGWDDAINLRCHFTSTATKETDLLLQLFLKCYSKLVESSWHLLLYY